MIDPADKAAFLDRTSPSELEKMRMRNHLRAEISRDEAIARQAREATAIDEASVAHLARRLQRRRARLVRLSPRWVAGGVLLAPLLAAALLLYLARPGEHEAAPELLSESLDLGDVDLKLDGLGSIAGDERAPIIRWESGRLGVAVTPGRGVSLSVITPEASVRVVGTEFVVEREDFATRVEVSHGTVEVTCDQTSPVLVRAPEQHTCLPTQASAWLRRSSALRRSDAPLALRRQAIEEGLRLADGKDLRAELLAQRAELLASVGERQQALQAAREYLSLGGPREGEMRELASALEGSGPSKAP